MGDPFFKFKDLLAKNNVHVFSSNYALYGDISHRIMSILQAEEPDVEVYSIDEAFLSLPYEPEKLHTSYALYLKHKIKRHTGIPVAIGIGPTKTLAKIATRIAKKNPQYNGVFDITDNVQIDELLANCETIDIWGIGGQSAQKLKANGIMTARDLRDVDNTWVRKKLTVTGSRTAMELRGISCISLETVRPDKKSIISSKSFGRTVSTLSEMKEAIATYLSSAAEKLRKQGSVAGVIQVFISTNFFNSSLPQHAQSIMVQLPHPSASTPTLLRSAICGLEEIYRPGFQYKRAGVMLTDIVSNRCRQQSLFEPLPPDNSELMLAVDRINKRWGRNMVQVGTAGFQKPWQMVQSFKSPAFTTNWSELPVVTASL